MQTCESSGILEGKFPPMFRNSMRSALPESESSLTGRACLAAPCWPASSRRDHVCVTRRAALGFHAASYYNDASRSLVPTRQGSALVMRLYPPEIRSWINHDGGLRPQMIVMRGHELSSLYPICQ